jgi:hypothetical protein
VRVLRAVELLVHRRVAQPEVAGHVDDLHARGDQLRHLRGRHLVRQREQRHVAAARRLGRAQILEAEVGRALEVRVHRAERLAHVVDRRHAHQLDVGVHQQAARELRAAVAATADDCCFESLRHRGRL